MARVALVTGGSRGIGAAISVALKAAGYKVAANYAGNDEAAAAFTKETGIPTFNGPSRITTPASKASSGSRPRSAPWTFW